ncbi:MAG TPA: hypothetical protein VLE95_08780 [Chlamydiales bacterium]|nr:hypothetical protein [Chlamydiales bacterium]
MPPRSGVLYTLGKSAAAVDYDTPVAAAAAPQATSSSTAYGLHAPHHYR